MMCAFLHVLYTQNHQDCIKHHPLYVILLIRRASSSFKHNASFVARLPTIRRHKSQSLHSPGNQKPPSGSTRGRCPRISDMNQSAENLGKSAIIHVMIGRGVIMWLILQKWQTTVDQWMRAWARTQWPKQRSLKRIQMVSEVEI